MEIFSSAKTTAKSLRARFSVSINFCAMRWAPHGLHSRVADPVPTPQCRHGTGDFRPKRNCWRWVWQYSYTQLLPQISREFTFSQAQILVALIVAYDKSILLSKWWAFSDKRYYYRWPLALSYIACLLLPGWFDPTQRLALSVLYTHISASQAEICVWAVYLSTGRE